MIEAIVLVLLLASAINLALMIPGGLVEVRAFDTYAAITLAAFNIFLTVLGLGSLVLAYVLYRNGSGYLLSALAGLGYVAVYGLDLGKIFPVSATPMSRLLATLEWFGTVLGVGLGAAAMWGWRYGNAPMGEAAPTVSAPMVIFLAVAGVGIVAFATRAAMRRR